MNTSTGNKFHFLFITFKIIVSSGTATTDRINKLSERLSNL